MFFVYLKSSANDEFFEMSNETFEKFQNYAFNQKFVIVINFCDRNDNFRKYYRCIYHDVKTQNNRKLNEHVDTKKIFINRQREMIKIKNFDCK